MHQLCFLMLFSVHFDSWFNYFRFSLLLLLLFFFFVCVCVCVWLHVCTFVYDRFDTKENNISTKHIHVEVNHNNINNYYFIHI